MTLLTNKQNTAPIQQFINFQANPNNNDCVTETH